MFWKWLRYLGVLGCVLLVGGNVGRLGGISGQSLVLVPCIPLGLALQIQCTRLGGVIVTSSSLLVETVELQELIVGGSLGEALGFLGGGGELQLKMQDISINILAIHTTFQLLLTSMFDLWLQLLQLLMNADCAQTLGLYSSEET